MKIRTALCKQISEDIDCLQIEEVELRAPRDFPLQLDGDAVAMDLPVTVRLAPKQLQILAP